MTQIKQKIAAMLELPDETLAEAWDLATKQPGVCIKSKVAITRNILLGVFCDMPKWIPAFQFLESKLEPEQGRDLESIFKKYAIGQWNWEDEWPSDKRLLTFEQFQKAFQELQQPAFPTGEELQRTIGGLANPENFTSYDSDNDLYFNEDKTIKTLTDFANWLKKESSK